MNNSVHTSAAEYARPLDSYEEYIAAKRLSEEPTLVHTAVLPVNSPPRNPWYVFFFPDSSHNALHNVLVALLLPVSIWFLILGVAISGAWGVLTGPYWEPFNETTQEEVQAYYAKHPRRA